MFESDDHLDDWSVGLSFIIFLENELKDHYYCKIPSRLHGTSAYKENQTILTDIRVKESMI